jgi:hypothetical protein
VNDLIELETLPVETLAEMANEAAAACEASGRKTVEHAIRCGRALLAAKAQVKHGEWLNWLQSNFHHTRQHADRFIEIANCTRVCNLEEATSIRDALRMIAETPEKQARKAEREARKAEATPKPLAPATPAPQPQKPVVETITEASTHHSVAVRVAKPAWLADPDELDRPEEDLTPLPKTNTHHTFANRREPDARETDRAGIVPPQDPRTLEDGAWYEWSEDLGRLVLVTDDAVLEKAKEIGQARGLWLVFSEPTPEPPATKKVVERERDTKRFVRPTVSEVAAYATEIGAAIDPEQFCDFYESKAWMIGKNKMKDWKAAVRTWKRGQAAKPGTAENGKVRSANWEDDGTGWEDLRNG